MAYQRKFAALLTLLMVAGCWVLMPTRAHASCDVTTIAGNYGFKLHELVRDPASTSALLPIGTSVPGNFVGRIVFNSATGTVTGFRTGNEGGLPLTNTFNGDQSTYSVNGDCTGTLKLALDDGSTRVYEIAIVQGGAEIELAEKGGASVAVVGDGDAKRQPATCDATTIAGDFGVRFNRLLAGATTPAGSTIDLDHFRPADSSGLIHFDPTTTPPSVSGHLSGITDGVDSFTTTFFEPESYSVNPDCTGTLTFTDLSGESKTLAMAIVEDGAGIEIEFANTTTNGSIVGEGVGKKQ